MRRTRYADCVIGVLAMVLLGRGQALAQPETPIAWPCPDTTTCSPTPTSAAYHDDEKDEPWYPEEGTFTPDRRPSYLIFLWGHGAAYWNNPPGLDYSWWNCQYPTPSTDDCPCDLDENNRPDQFDWLIDQIEFAYEHGYRRITLYIPAGEVRGQNVPSSQWWTMAPWRQYWFMRDHESPPANEEDPGIPGGVKWWLDEHKDVELGIYMGYPIADPCSLCADENAYSVLTYTGGNYYLPCYGAAEAHMPSPMNQSDMIVFRQNVKPWIDVGLKMFWIDAGGYGPFRESFREVSHSPDYEGVKFGGEGFAIDVDTQQSRYVPSAPFMIANPYLNIFSVVEGSSFNGPKVPDDAYEHTWNAPPGWEATLLMIGYPSTTEWNASNRLNSLYQHYASRGFTFMLPDSDYIYGTPAVEMAERIFGFGYIEHAGDFDGNGTVDSSDFYRYLAFWDLAQSYTGPNHLTYYHGDMNNDGIVNSSDFFDFLTIHGNDESLDLGPINWDMTNEWIATYDEGFHYP